MIFYENTYLDFDKYISYAFWTFFISFLYCNFYVTNLTFKHKDEDEYDSNILEKIRIFMILSSFILGAVLLQPKLNEIFNKEESPAHNST
jgi:hypothetical protein